MILSRYIRKTGWNVKYLPRGELEKQLEVIHRNGIAHNDIKKDNILYDEVEDKAYIMDFSVSFLTDSKEESSRSIEEMLESDKNKLIVILT